MKKNTYFCTRCPFAKAMSFAFQRLPVVIRLISIFVLPLIVNGELGAHLPK